MKSIIVEILLDYYDISPSSSCVYGTMFLENLALADTFMTDAQNDLIVYAPTLPSQFGKNRFGKIVKSISIDRGNASARAGSFTVKYKPNSVEGLKSVPTERTVGWYFYSESGHSVSSTQPKELREDITGWLTKH